MSLLQIDYLIRDQIINAQKKGFDSVTITFPYIAFWELRILEKIPGFQVQHIWQSPNCDCDLRQWCICRETHVGVKISWTMNKIHE